MAIDSEAALEEEEGLDSRGTPAATAPGEPGHLPSSMAPESSSTNPNLQLLQGDICVAVRWLWRRGPPLALAGKKMSAPSAKKSTSEAAAVLRPPCRPPSFVPLRRHLAYAQKVFDRITSPGTSFGCSPGHGGGVPSATCGVEKRLDLASARVPGPVVFRRCGEGQRMGAWASMQRRVPAR
jgi:hypothetical protein